MIKNFKEKIISNSRYNMGRKKLNFSRKDFKKSNALESGFKTKALALKFWKTTPKNKLSNFNSVDELTDYIKTQKDKLENIGIDVNSKRKPRLTKDKMKNKKIAQALEAKLKQYDEKNKVKKFHLTAEIQRKITYTKTNTKTKTQKQYEYAHDSLLDSRVIEATSEAEARKIMAAEIEQAFEQDEYSGAAKYSIDAIEFIDTVNESTLKTQHPSQMKMKQATHINYSFTNEEKKFLNEKSTWGTCVIDNFVGMYGKELKLTRDDFIKLHQEYYGTFSDTAHEGNEAWKKIHGDTYLECAKITFGKQIKEYDSWRLFDGITPLFLEYICKKYDISHYAYDITNKCFMKYISKNRNHPALVYYAINDHMYLVKEEYKKSLVAKAKEEHNINTSLLEGREKVNPFDDMKIIENIDFNDVDKYDDVSCVFMFSRRKHNINDIFDLFVAKYNLIPSVDKTRKTNILQFTHKTDNGNIHIYAADPNDIHIITYKQVKYHCEKHNIEWKNQTFTQFIKEVKDRFFLEKNGRVQFTANQRHAILKRFDFKCNKCKTCITDNEFDIDHIRPLANGGTNKASNLQPLCNSCHADKCSNEHENGEYIKLIDSESTFNNHIQKVMDSPLAQTHAFIENIVKENIENRKIFTIDNNKCRKNIVYYGVNDYCVFTVFDKVKKYKVRSNILKGLYYVESDNYIPLRGNGWYYHNMIEYCLKNGIITHDNIKYQIISSLTIPSNYYNEFIEYCYKHIDNYEVICDKLNIATDEKRDYKKLCINITVGNFKPNLNKRVNWSSLCITNNSSEAFTTYINHDGAFIHSFMIDGKVYYHALKQRYTTNLETESPIYNQILQQEQIELHKLMKIVESNKGTVLDVNTDSVTCIFEDDKFPFDLDGINLKGYYWDNENLVPKYKIEDKGRLKTSRMSNSKRTEKYIHDIKYEWNITPDVDNNNFEPLVDKIINSNASCTIQGPGGVGKSQLVNMVKHRLREMHKTDKVKVEEEKVEKVKEKEDNIFEIKKSDSSKMKTIKEQCVNIQLRILKSNERLKTKLSNSRRLKTEESIHKCKKQYEEALKKLDKQIEEDKIIKAELKIVDGCVSLAPTNLAALIIDGMTIHKFACLIKSYEVLQAMNLKYIFVDEVSMLQEKFYKFLLALKKLKPDLKFIISGDYSQLLPVCDRITTTYDYSRNPAIYELCDFNMIQLTKCRRADDKLFNLIKFENVPNLKPEHFTTTSDITKYDIHLCYTNKKRIKINDIMMKHKAIDYKGGKIDINKLFWDSLSQDVILQIDTPIIAKINNKDIGIVNNERFKITAIEKNIITIKNEFKTIQFDAVENNSFQRCFRVAYCTTIHSSQGLSIGESYLIHQWNNENFDQRLKYVALSRARSYEIINIYQ